MSVAQPTLHRWCADGHELTAVDGRPRPEMPCELRPVKKIQRRRAG